MSTTRSESPPVPLRSRLAVGASVLLAALLLGGLEAFSVHVGAARLGRPVTWGHALVSTVPSWLVLAVLAGPVRVLCRVARLRPANWPTRLPIHLIGAGVFVVVASGATGWVNVSLGRLGGEPWWAAGTRYFYTYLAYDVVIYATLVGAFHALDYLRESEHRERERARLAASLVEARLNVLRSQLSPHFFFNTLNAISTFSLQGRPVQVGEMVGALGELVRVSLDESTGHEVTLERELEYLDLYLDIQRVRFSDWLRVVVDVAPEARDARVPSLVLQPLMENAIKHGAPGEDGTVSVALRGRVEGDDLVIEITNPRPRDGRDTRLGVGLRNSRERLEQLHPGRHTFEFGPAGEGDFRVAFRIPVRRGGVEDSAEFRVAAEERRA